MVGLKERRELKDVDPMLLLNTDYGRIERKIEKRKKEIKAELNTDYGRIERMIFMLKEFFS